MTPPLIFGGADIAFALGVTRAAVSNWLSRFPESIPAAAAITPDGRLYWDMDGLRLWKKWHVEHGSDSPGVAGAEKRRLQVMTGVMYDLNKGEPS